jgi:hypothetical protein
LLKAVSRSILYTAFFLGVPLTGAGESSISKQVQKVVNRLEKVDVVIVYETWEWHSEKHREAFLKLRELATPGELILLSQHENPVVRFDACRLLVADSSTDVLGLVLSHLGDMGKVPCQYGCTRRTEAFIDVLIFLVTTGPFDDLPLRQLTETSLRTLDSVILHSQYPLDARWSALRRAGTEESYYHRIRQLASVDHYGPAIVALAKFKRADDIELIRGFSADSTPFWLANAEPPYWTCLAIQEFPHPDLFPWLRDCFLRSMNRTGIHGIGRELYAAIASYQNAEATELFATACSSPVDWGLRTMHAEKVYEAMRKFLCPAYDSLLWEIWNKNQIITQDVFLHLVEADSSRALALAGVTLKYALELYYSNQRHDELDATPQVLKAMLDYVIPRDREQATQSISENLSIANVFLYPPFAEAACRMRNTSFVWPLLHRVSREGNPHIYLKAVEALLSYNDTIIDRQMLSQIKVNDSLRKGWGGDSLRVLLRSHGLK